MEACVLEGGGAGGFYYRAIERHHGKDIADAAPELPMQVQGRESAPRFRQMSSGRFGRDVAVFESSFNRIVRHSQQHRAFFRGILARLGMWMRRVRAGH